MRGMLPPRFSLATLLICVTVFAVVVAVCIRIPVILPDDSLFGDDFISRPPRLMEVARRLVVWWPISVVATLVIIGSIRHLQRRNRPEQTSTTARSSDQNG